MRAATVALLLLALAAPVSAQAPAPAANDASADQPQTPSSHVDPGRLGVSMARIQRGLRIAEARERSSTEPLRLEFQVQVFGAAPRLDFLEGFDYSPTAPISYGAPTHAEFLQHWTPQAFRAPAAPLSQIAGWALVQLAKRSDKSKCEREIADYRALVMQGIAAPAPRCTQ